MAFELKILSLFPTVPAKLFMTARRRSQRSWLVGCLTSQQQASVSQGRICSDHCTCCHTEIQVADQTFYLTQSQYIDTRPTSPSADPRTPGAWQGGYWSADFGVTGVSRHPKNPGASGIRTGIFRSRGGRLTTRPTRWSQRRHSAAYKPPVMTPRTLLRL